MELPKIIHPHNLKETVVEIKYDSQIPFEVLIGYFFEAFDESYSYTNRPLKQQNLIQPNISAGLSIQIGTVSILYNSVISLLLQPNSFIFNVIDTYPGWQAYSEEIKKALYILAGTKKVKQFTRVGLRYISEYENKDLKKLIKFTFSFDFPDIASETAGFRSTFDYENKKIILNLNNQLPVNKSANPHKPEIIKLSTIDIDVLDESVKTEDVEKLIYIIESNHLVEKKIFFKMITKEFLDSLNPQY